MQSDEELFGGMVDQQNAFSLNSSWDHCQRSTSSQISNMLWAGFESMQNLSSGFVEWSCAVVITNTPRYQLVTQKKNFYKNVCVSNSKCNIIFAWNNFATQEFRTSSNRVNNQNCNYKMQGRENLEIWNYSWNRQTFNNSWKKTMAIQTRTYHLFKRFPKVFSFRNYFIVPYWIQDVQKLFAEMFGLNPIYNLYH